MSTALLDLPPEILLGLHPEGFLRPLLLHGARHHDQQWKEDIKIVAALARTCRKLYSIYHPVLYKSLIPTSLSLAKRCQLFSTLVGKPALADLIEDLKLDMFTRGLPSRDPWLDGLVHTVMVPDCLDAPGTGWYGLLGRLLLPTTGNLRRISIRCTQFKSIRCNFDHLIKAHIQCYGLDEAQGLDEAGVRQLLLAPKIQSLIFSGPYINDAHNLEALRSSSSHVSFLALRLAMISQATLKSILRLPKNLTSFEFYSVSMTVPTTERAKDDNFITFGDLNNSLQSQKDNLVTVKICFPSSDVRLPLSVFGGLTFSNFSRLTKLSIAPEMFLGMKECKHRSTEVNECAGPPHAITFVQCLPYCLEELTLYIRQDQRARNGDGHARDLVRGILEQSEEFYKLRLIEIGCSKGIVLCDGCCLEGCAYLDKSPAVKKSEIDEIDSVCKCAGISFRWIEDVWERL